MTSTELLLLFSFTSLAPVILFGNLMIQGLRGSDRVGVESRWGGIGGGGGGWGLTRPATWLLLTLFFSLFSALLISATAQRAADAEARRDRLVLEVSRRALVSHRHALAALQAAQSDAERTVALAQLQLALSSHEDAVSALETLWTAEKSEPSAAAATTTATTAAKPAAKSPETPAEKPAEKPPSPEPPPDVNPRAVEP